MSRRFVIRARRQNFFFNFWRISDWSIMQKLEKWNYFKTFFFLFEYWKYGFKRHVKWLFINILTAIKSILSKWKVKMYLFAQKFLKNINQIFSKECVDPNYGTKYNNVDINPVKRCKDFEDKFCRHIQLCLDGK